MLFRRASIRTIRLSRFSTQTDQELQLSYSGLMPRLITLQNLFKPEGRKFFNDLASKNVLNPSDLLTSLSVFADLYNPLLKKYNFDASEFLVGAKEAFTQVHMAMASKEFSNFANGFVQESESASLLRAALCPRLYKACLDASKHLHASGVSMNMDEIKVTSLVISGISTHIHDEETAERDKMVRDIFASVKNENENDDQETLVDETKENKYQTGSVIAEVDVFYNSSEKYTNKFKIGEHEGAKKISRNSRTRWTYQGCISGQTELDWTIVAFDGLGRTKILCVKTAKLLPQMEKQAFYHYLPQNAPGASAAIGHKIENSIPLSIFPIALDKFCFCFCGLPGRGKTHISRRLAKYLSFFHAVPVEVFNVGEYRRRMCGALKDAEWFDPHNLAAQALRDNCNLAAINDMVSFLNENANGIVILDSTNPTHQRRVQLVKSIRPTGAKIMFIEVSNENLIDLDKIYAKAVQNIPDYVGLGLTESELDYRKRIANYQLIYEPLDSGYYHSIESKFSYMKCDHSSQHFVINNVRGYLQQKVVNFVMNLRTTSHAFFLSRHGQSEYNDLGRIGGDSGLTQHGVKYAEKLAEFVDSYIVKDNVGNDVPARLWTSTMRRTKETTQFIKHPTIKIKSEQDDGLEYEWVQMRPRAWHHLDELFAGSCDGMTYDEIAARYPQEWDRRNVDKLAYRYPNGESYLDVIARLEPIIIEMERHQENLLIVAHQGILRIIYAFYMGLSRAEAPYVSIPLNCVVELTPEAITCKEKRHFLYEPEMALSHDGQDEPHKRKTQTPVLEDNINNRNDHNIIINDNSSSSGNNKAYVKLDPPADDDPQSH